MAVVADAAVVADVNADATPPRPKIGDTADEAQPVVARDDGERDEGRGRGGRRRRRGGRDRDRDRGERNRTPDIAADGGEMLDFHRVGAVPRGRGRAAKRKSLPSKPAPLAAAPIEPTPVFDAAPVDSEPAEAVAAEPEPDAGTRRG